MNQTISKEMKQLVVLSSLSEKRDCVYELLDTHMVNKDFQSELFQHLNLVAVTNHYSPLKRDDDMEFSEIDSYHLSFFNRTSLKSTVCLYLMLNATLESCNKKAISKSLLKPVDNLSIIVVDYLLDRVPLRILEVHDFHILNLMMDKIEMTEEQFPEDILISDRCTSKIFKCEDGKYRYGLERRD